MYWWEKRMYIHGAMDSEVLNEGIEASTILLE